jgi:hypothetical protein
MRVVITEHFVERAPVAQEIDQEDWSRLGFRPGDPERFSCDIGPALTNHRNRGTVVKRTTSPLRAPLASRHGTPSKTQ